MADKKGKQGKPDKSAAEYYQLKTKAVDELVNANVTNTPEVPEKELKKYRHKSLLNLRDGVKYFLLKAWFAGVVCWFCMIGLGTYGIATLDMMLIMGIATGLLWDLPVNIFIRMKAEKKEFGKYMMFPGTGVLAGLLNVVYGIVLVFLVSQVYALAGRVLFRMGSETILSVEPILYGLFTAAWDWLALQFKKLGGSILADAKRKASGAAGGTNRTR